MGFPKEGGSAEDDPNAGRPLTELNVGSSVDEEVPEPNT